MANISKQNKNLAKKVPKIDLHRVMTGALAVIMAGSLVVGVVVQGIY